MGEIQKLYVTLGLKAGEFAEGIDGAAQKAQGFASRLRAGVGGAIGTVASIGRTAFLGVGAAAAAGFGIAMRSAINMNSSLESSTLQFETLMGDADRAREHVEGLFAFAGKTPFETGPIIEASRVMQVFGGDALNTEENLMRIGDTAAAVGAPIEDIGFWVGRAYAAIQGGQPFGEAAQNLMQMGAVSPQVIEQMKQLEEQGASADEIFAVLQGHMDGFSGAMEKQAGTWEGLTSTIKDNVNLLIAGALKPFFDLMKEGLAGVAEWLQSPAVQEGITTFAANLTALVEKVAVFVKEQVIPFVVDHGPQLLQVLKVLAIAFGALLIIGAVSTALSFLLSPIGLITAAVGLLAAAWTNNWGGIRDKTMAAWAVIQPLLAQAWEWLQVHVPAALEVLRAAWVDVVWPKIQSVIQTVWPIVKAIFTEFIRVIKEIVIPTIVQLYEQWKEKWDANMVVLRAVWEVIEAIFKEVVRWIRVNIVPWVEFLAKKWKAEWDAMVVLLTAAWEKIKPVLQFLLDKFRDVMGGIGDAIGPAKSIFTGLVDAVTGFWNWLKGKVFNFQINIPDLPDWAVPGSPLPIHTAWLAFARDAGRIGKQLNAVGAGLESSLAVNVNAAVAGRVGEDRGSQTIHIYGGYNVSSMGDGRDTLSDLYYKRQ